MSDQETNSDNLDWDENAPNQKPTVAEDGAWGGDWKNYYDAVTGGGSRNASFDKETAIVPPEISTGFIPNDADTEYTNTHQRFGMFGGLPAHIRTDGDTVDNSQRVSGRYPNGGDIRYEGGPQSSATGMNMLQSAAAPLTLGQNTIQNIGKIDSLNDWDGWTGLATGLAGDLAAVGNMVDEYNAFVEHITNPKFDPVQWLAGTLIDFLIQAFQPLEDLVGLVSGNETRMKDSASMWNTVATGAKQVGEHIQQSGVDALSDWVGHDGDAARTRVDEMGASVQGMGFLAEGMEALLLQMADIAKLLRQDIVDLIAKGVSWMLTRLLPQAAAAVATFGAWAASMVAQGIAKVASLVLKALSSISRVVSTASEAAQVVNKILQGIQNLKPVLSFFSSNKNLINLAGGVAEQAWS
ncbi:hypothetical protein L0U85_00610 [Glycomyces sp. L485]|uniref:hypothetical protein n=1 Tax=Glycomyces sp. L485 TaxID=2909235 RepID=UPI001F4B816D|nr:hypothetical protein [Glycomyces sp. L485]MCH7229370.1 hypothetical protein [Glycomyces sp. L485]